MKKNIFWVVVICSTIAVQVSLTGSLRTSAILKSFKILKKPMTTEAIEKGIKKSSDDICRTVINTKSKTASKGLFKQASPTIVLAGGAAGGMMIAAHGATSPARALGKSISDNDDIAETSIRYVATSSTIVTIFIILIIYRIHRKKYSKHTRARSNC